jgi:hypothetical protein
MGTGEVNRIRKMKYGEFMDAIILSHDSSRMVSGMRPGKVNRDAWGA